MVSDSELIDHLREFLRTSDLNTTTTAIVRRKLEEDFGIDLSDRKAFIRTQVDLFLQTQVEKPQEDANEPEQKPKLKSEANGASDSEEESEVEEEEEKSEEEASGNGKRKRKKVSKTKNKDVQKRQGGFNKVSGLSPELQKLLGVSEMARTGVVKQLWAYIRERDLQDPENRKSIRCDEALRALFRVDSIDMFQMNKALSEHIFPLNSETGAPVPSTPKEKKRKKEKHEDSDEPQPKEKKKGPGTGFLAPLPLSDALVKFIGTGESILTRPAVVQKVWAHIKENNLQDPSDKRKIVCDDKLKELFGVDSFIGFTMPKLLRDHFIKAEQ